MTFLVDNIILIALALASGGLLLWPLLSRSAGGTALSPLEATQLINHRNAIIVDLRDEKEFAAGSLAGARNIPQPTVKDRAGELSRFKSRPLLLICATGQQSEKSLKAFQDAGFAETFSMAGGIDAWKKAALPLVQAGRDNTRPVVKDGGKRGRGDQRGKTPKTVAALVAPIDVPATATANAPTVAAGEPASMPAEEALAATDGSSAGKAA